MTGRVYIRGVVKFSNIIARFMSEAHTTEEWKQMGEDAADVLRQIEEILKKSGAVPEDLPSQSRMAYYAIREFAREWRKKAVMAGTGQSGQGRKAPHRRKGRTGQGLSGKRGEEKNAKNVSSSPSGHKGSGSRLSEVTAPELRLQRIAEEMAKKLGLKELVSAEFYRFTTLRLTGRLRNGVLHIRVSHLLRDAPEFVLASAVATIILKRLGKSDAYYSNIFKNYVKTDEMAKRVEGHRQSSARKELRGEKGRYHNLRQSFNRVNRRYFHNSINGLTLTWGRAGRRTLGHYDHAKRTIAISSLLDSPDVPDYVLDYIMYHEMLHHVLRAHYSDGRRVVHSREFRERERDFAHYEKAKQRIVQLFG